MENHIKELESNLTTLSTQGVRLPDTDIGGTIGVGAGRESFIRGQREGRVTWGSEDIDRGGAGGGGGGGNSGGGHQSSIDPPSLGGNLNPFDPLNSFNSPLLSIHHHQQPHASGSGTGTGGHSEGFENAFRTVGENKYAKKITPFHGPRSDPGAGEVYDDGKRAATILGLGLAAGMNLPFAEQLTNPPNNQPQPRPGPSNALTRSASDRPPNIPDFDINMDDSRASSMSPGLEAIQGKRGVVDVGAPSKAPSLAEHHAALVLEVSWSSLAGTGRSALSSGAGEES